MAHTRNVGRSVWEGKSEIAVLDLTVALFFAGVGLAITFLPRGLLVHPGRITVPIAAVGSRSRGLRSTDRTP